MKLAQLARTYREIQVYLHNSYWIMGERIVTLSLAFVATIVIARYLGPNDFGLLAYALSLTTLFASAGHLGLSGLVVREIVKAPEAAQETVGTTAVLKLIGMSIGYFTLLIYATVFEGIASTQFLLIAIAGLALLFRSSDVIGFWFQANIQARYVAIAQITSHGLATALMLGLVLAGSGLTYFATVHLTQAVIAACLLLLFFGTRSEIHISQLRFSLIKAKNLLHQGWVIYLGAIFAVIYLKVDLIMLRWLADTQAVGQYAVAAQLSEAWYFVPTAIVASFFPKLIQLRDQNETIFYRRLQALFDALFVIGLTAAVVVTLMAPWLIDMLFGPRYAASASIIVIHIWAGVFVSMRAAFSKWILIENALYFSLLTQGLGALSNVLLNFILIPQYGGEGAAYATLISYAVASFFALLIYRRTRHVFWLMCRAMLAPIRYPASYVFTR